MALFSSPPDRCQVRGRFAQESCGFPWKMMCFAGPAVHTAFPILCCFALLVLLWLWVESSLGSLYFLILFANLLLPYFDVPCLSLPQFPCLGGGYLVPNYLGLEVPVSPHGHLVALLCPCCPHRAHSINVPALHSEQLLWVCGCFPPPRPIFEASK